MGYLYLNLNVKVLKLIAMYNMDHKGAAFRAFYSFWRFLAAGSIFIVSIQSLLDILLRDSTEFLDISSQILNFGIHTCAVVRLVYFYAFSKSVNDLVTGMNRDFKYKSLGVFEEKTMEGHVGISVKLCKFWIFNVVFTTQTINLFSWISTVLFGKPRSLGIPLWYPWDWKKSPYFELSVLGRTFTNFFLSFAYGNVDNFFVSAVFLTAGQFAILGSDLKNVIYNSLVKFGISRREVSDFRNDFLEGRLDVEGKRYPGISSALKTAEFQNFLKENFKDVVEHHRKLVAYCGALEDFFSPILLPLLGFGVFYVIFIAFVAATVSIDFLFLIYFIYYFYFFDNFQFLFIR